MSAAPQVQVEDTADALASGVAAQAVQVLTAAITERDRAHLVITGGGILEATLAALAGHGELDWGKVHVWWGDERYVPSDSTDRNDLPAIAKLFDHVGPAILHRMPASDTGYGEDVDTAADSYAGELASAAYEGDDVPRFDLVLLGVGPDGHCASLFPGHPGTRVLDATVIAVPDSPKPPPVRLSLTFPALDAADEVWFVVSGEGKAHAVARALGGAPRDEVPSAGPRGRRRTLWLLDRAAASELPA